MSGVIDSVGQALRDCQRIETSSFYQDYQDFSRLYDSLIQKGVTQRRESQLKTIQDQKSPPVFAYNITKRFNLIGLLGDDILSCANDS